MRFEGRADSSIQRCAESSLGIYIGFELSASTVALQLEPMAEDDSRRWWARVARLFGPYLAYSVLRLTLLLKVLPPDETATTTVPRPACSDQATSTRARKRRHYWHSIISLFARQNASITPRPAVPEQKCLHSSIRHALEKVRTLTQTALQTSPY